MNKDHGSGRNRGPWALRGVSKDSETQVLIDQDDFGLLHIVHLPELDQQGVADPVGTGAVIAAAPLDDTGGAQVSIWFAVS